MQGGTNNWNALHYVISQTSTKLLLLIMEETLISLDEMVISANRWEQDSREIPVHIAKIKPAEDKPEENEKKN